MENTQSNATQGAQLQSVPQITSFQFDRESIGKIKDSVNLFRGTVSLPLNLVTLPGLNDLDVNFMLLYGSNVKSSLENWNLSNPTTTVGLGWQTLEDKIVVNKNNSGALASDEYYLISAGSANRLIQTATNQDGGLTFQLSNYEFWDIQYFPNKELWKIIHEDGTVHLYGDNQRANNALEFGVEWGNWMGNSALALGQEQYATAWNLSEKSNVWGNSVNFEYEQETQFVGGATGKQYTQACYLKQVTDSLGRRLIYNYGDKYGAQNPGPNGITEYPAKNTKQPAPNAYQDTYETKFLESFEVVGEAGRPLFSINFGYDFINTSNQQGTQAYNLLYKRVLTKIWQVSPEGRQLPGYEFTYFDKSTEKSPGSLESITFPYGGSAKYNYKTQNLTATRNQKVNSPISGSTPRVWFGPDYSVITWYNKASKQMKAQVFSWSGTWTQTQLSSEMSSIGPFRNVDFDLETLGVITKQDFIVIYFTNKATNSLELYFYCRNQENFGTFDLKKGPERIALKPGAGASSVVFGDNYLVACNKGFASKPFHGYQWSWKEKLWQNNRVRLPSSSDAQSADYTTISAKGNYYITCFYTTDQNNAKFELIHHDGADSWQNPVSWSDRFTIYQDSANPEEFPFAFSLADSYASCTYVTGIETSKVSYSTRIYQWNKNYFILSPGSSVVNDYESPIINQQSQFKVLQTFNNGSLIANNPYLNRYVGGGGSSNNPQNWITKQFSTSASNQYDFAFGSDTAVMSEDGNGAISKYFQFNPNSPNSGGWGSPKSLGSKGKHPTLLGDYITSGSDVFRQQPNGNWTKLNRSLINLTAPETVQNRAPQFIAYQDNMDAGAQTYIAFTKNGELSMPEKVTPPSGARGQKVYVDQENQLPGTMLAGLNTFVTYPSDQNFDEASYISLYRVEEGAVTGNLEVAVVANVNIENFFSPSASFWQSYDYTGSPTSTITYDATNSLPQFPQIRVIPNTKSPDDQKRPNGSVVNYFSNGVSEQSSLPYPNKWIYNYNLLLNGSPLGKTIFDSKGANVGSALNFFSIYTKDPNGRDNLYSGYARKTKQINVQDGVTKSISNDYYPNTGQLKSSSFTYFDSEGKAQRQTVEKRYAIQEAEYSDAMKKLNLLTNVVQEIVSLTDLSTDVKKTTSSKATTWKNWGDVSNPRWAAYQKYQWEGPDTGTPVFSFPPNGDRNGWLPLSEVVSRAPETGNIEEQTNTDGMPTSYLYDRKGQYQIAEFPNASAIEDEVGYYSFETSESAGSWQLGGGATVVPNQNDTTIDAHTGINSVKISPSTGSGNGVSGGFTPTNANQDLYLFSCFFKKPVDFNSADGEAQWRISFQQGGGPVGSPIEVDLPDVKGEWGYLFTAIDLGEFDRSTKGDVTLAIEAINGNSARFVLFDNLRFSPHASAMAAVNIAENSANIDAIVGANGETQRNLLDDFQQQIGATNQADQTSQLQTYYYSRSGNNNQLSLEVPNSKLVLNGVAGGAMCLFTRGQECWKTWDQGSSADWQIANQKLEWGSANPGALTLRDSATVDQYAISTEVVTKNAPTNPLGIKVGGAYTIQYDPSASEWQLLKGEAGAGNGRIVDRKSYNRLHMSNDADPNAYGTHWLLIVGTQSILFFVDGKQLFGHLDTQAISGVPELFVADPCAVNYLVNSRGNRVNQTYLDSSASDLQSQLLFNSKTSAVQNIYDNMGRPAIHTKPAYITPRTSDDLLEYRADLASYDWSTETMSGTILQIYPDDEGYPYFRQMYEESSLGRVIRSTMPGKVYNEESNTLRTRYTANDGSLGLPSNQYFKQIQTGQNGEVSYSITDQCGNEIYKVSQKGATDAEVIKGFNQLDASGNPISQRVPNYYNPPAGSVADDWVVTNEFDYFGRNTMARSSDSGEQQMIYDNSGRLRFRQDAQGSLDSTYQYLRYDIQGRLIETGYLKGDWNEAQLANFAQSDPEWPPTPTTWRKKFSFDGDGTIDNQIGRLVVVETNGDEAGTATSTERYAYDISGNIVKKDWSAKQVGSDFYTTAYVYNQIGEITLVKYPTTNDEAPMAVSYGYNEVGQVIGVGSSAEVTDDIASYSYNAAGKPETEVLNSGGTTPITKRFRYNSPVWLENITATAEGASSPLFQETMTFRKASGTQETTYYNGQPSTWGFEYRGLDDTRVCKFDALGALTSSESSSSGKNNSYSYDENSNFKEVTKEGDAYEIQYNRNNSIKSYGSTAGNTIDSEFLYNANGDISGVTDRSDGGNVSRKLGFIYDPGTGLTSSVDDLLKTDTRYSYLYDGLNQRIIKDTSEGGASQGMKVYVRGINTSSLITFDSTGQNTVNNAEYLIHGPMGLLALSDLSTVKFLVKDHLNSTRLVVDDTATILAAYKYDVFGSTTVLQGAATGTCAYLYTGQEWDPELSLYNFKSRFYFADIGRFAATDPGSQFYSPYIYAGNNPIQFIDPSGNFSIGNFFSAIAGAIIGVVEILIGVVIDVVAGFLEVVTGGLATPVAVGLAALSGFFYGAGTSALAYSVVGLVTNDFSWKDYGISMGIGAATGAIASGFGAYGAAVQASAKATVAATEAGQTASTLTRVASTAAKPAFQIAGSAVAGTTGTFLNNAAYGRSLGTGLGDAFIKSTISGALGWAIPTPAYAAGWGQYAKRAAANVAKSEAIGLSLQTGTNLVYGKSLDTGLLNTVVKGVVGGAKSAIGAKGIGKAEGEDFNAMFDNI